MNDLGRNQCSRAEFRRPGGASHAVVNPHPSVSSADKLQCRHSGERHSMPRDLSGELGRISALSATGWQVQFAGIDLDELGHVKSILLSTLESATEQRPDPTDNRRFPLNVVTTQVRQPNHAKSILNHEAPAQPCAMSTRLHGFALAAKSLAEERISEPTELPKAIRHFGSTIPRISSWIHQHTTANFVN